MRSMKQRVVALFLCVLMVVTSIGVQPTQVSAEANSSYANVSWGGGSTEVAIDIGVRFSLVNYATYKAWSGGNIDTISPKKSLKMKSLEKKWVGDSKADTVRSRYVIYVGPSDCGDSKCWSVTGTGKTNITGKSVSVKSYGKIKNIIKVMSKNNSDAKTKWKSLMSSSTNRKSPTKWKDAFNSLETAVLKLNYSTAQNKLVRAFEKYNSLGVEKEIDQTDK